MHIGGGRGHILFMILSCGAGVVGDFIRPTRNERFSRVCTAMFEFVVSLAILPSCPASSLPPCPAEIPPSHDGFDVFFFRLGSLLVALFRDRPREFCFERVEISALDHRAADTRGRAVGRGRP